MLAFIAQNKNKIYNFQNGFSRIWVNFVVWIKLRMALIWYITRSIPMITYSNFLVKMLKFPVSPSTARQGFQAAGSHSKLRKSNWPRLKDQQLLFLCFDSLDLNSIFFDRLDPSLLCFNRARSKQLCSTVLDPSKICFDRGGLKLSMFLLSNNLKYPKLNVIISAFRATCFDTFIRMKWFELFAIYMLYRDQLFLRAKFSIFWITGCALSRKSFIKICWY